MGLGINLGATEIIVDMVRDVGAPEMMFYKRHPAGARRGELEAKRIDDLFETAKSWAIIGPKGSYFCNGMIVDAPKLVRDGVAKHKWVLVTLEPRWIGDRTDWLAGDVSW
ncbi:MAG: hypothetical protein K1X74_23275 [Pirellulales bacterium]|nr:hypothetical protein [Pirellulales bacterium]